MHIAASVQVALPVEPGSVKNRQPFFVQVGRSDDHILPDIALLIKGTKVDKQPIILQKRAQSRGSGQNAAPPGATFVSCQQHGHIVEDVLVIPGWRDIFLFL